VQFQFFYINDNSNS